VCSIARFRYAIETARIRVQPIADCICAESAPAADAAKLPGVPILSIFKEAVKIHTALARFWLNIAGFESARPRNGATAFRDVEL